MNSDELSADELIRLIERVFPLGPDDHRLKIMVDMPANEEHDTSDWRIRREIACNWYRNLTQHLVSHQLNDIGFLIYPDVGSNNADLPEYGYLVRNLPESTDPGTWNGEKISFEKVFETTDIFMVPTQYSATAPMKNAARKYQFRGATMPGFSPKMIPALRIDYDRVNRRVERIQEKLSRAIGVSVDFLIDNDINHRVYFDVRFREAHASSGRFPNSGTAGNLPSGESYIVPFEGNDKNTSRTEGILPLQLDDTILLYQINQNVATDISMLYETGDEKILSKELAFLALEPAYGNMAELGFGVLGDFGLSPINQMLLDEKLGFHVAFGRSDHFGGAVGPGDFSDPKNVIHLDQIYIESLQPRVLIKSITLEYESGEKEIIMAHNRYTIFS